MNVSSKVNRKAVQTIVVVGLTVSLFQNCAKVGFDSAVRSPESAASGALVNPNGTRPATSNSMPVATTRDLTTGPVDSSAGNTPSDNTRTKNDQGSLTPPASAGNNDPTGSGSVPASLTNMPVTDPNVPIVCDPFTFNTACEAGSRAGLLGNIYYLLNGVTVQEYIDRGTKLKVTAQLANLNVPRQDWGQGFPGGDGSLLKNDNGEILNEWFLLDLGGYLTLPSTLLEGNYDFAIRSDDGSTLYLNGNLVVDNDGKHSEHTACTAAPIQLKHNVRLPMHLRYFQGPRYEISLQVYFRPASRGDLPCDINGGGWDIIPPGSLSH